MNEILKIENFGPLNLAVIKLTPVVVIIGGQGTGKSTISKVINIFKKTDFLLGSSNERENLFKECNIHNYFRIDTKLSFKSEQYSITYVNGVFKVVIKKGLKPLIDSYKKNKATNIITRQLLSDRSDLIERVEFSMGNAVYVPTERILIPILMNASFKLNQEKVNIPTYLLEFGNFFQIARIRIKNITFDFLDIEYKFDGTSDLVIQSKKTSLLSETASGFQTLLPMLITLTEQTSYDIVKGLFMIEEPELNLFPSTQYELTKYLNSRCLKVGDRILLTTHSPYILTSLNNLMYAYTVGQKHKKEVSKIIEEKYWVNPKDVSAYQLLNDGTAKNIIADDGLIMAENIDAVSREINEEYDLIQDIKIDFQNKES